MSDEGIPIVGDSPSIQAVIQTIQCLAATDATVLLTGESGTGKNLAARMIHDTSSRRAKPFVAVNCAALVESEVYGIGEGVATGVERRVGRIESANGGTLLLDEIGELSLSAQEKLLRVLEEREVEWVGGGKPIPINIRFIATTNRDLKGEVRQNRFRQDLFFRLNIIHIHMPALRDMRADIPVLATHFLREWATEYSRDIQGFSRDALKALVTYEWPGNVRHLKTTISRAVAFSEGKIIGADDLPRNTFDARELDGDVDPPQ